MSDEERLINIPISHEERVSKLIAAFREQFRRDPEGIAEAPGRVNLIGEHVDYNDGLVLPCAIDRSVMCAWAKDERAQHNWFHSVDYSQSDVDHPNAGSESPGLWADYWRGVIWSFANAGLAVHDAHTLGAISGNVPMGAGLSSSAALEVAIGGAFNASGEYDIGARQVAVIGQKAEVAFVGVQCGIMDQFASALSQRDHALLIDCRTLDYRHIPLRLAEHGLAIVIANSAVQRDLITSAYNDRRRECEEAVIRLRDLLGRPNLHSLRDVRSDEIAALDIAPDDAVLRRARHVVTEIDRVAEAVDALEHDDFTRLGELMVQSHLSLKTDYEVSSEQLDLLVGLATARDYVLGARLTGAGFGGCTVNLVRADRTEDFARDVIAPYRERTGLPAVMYVTEACDGLRAWRM